jgi:hypothetical protein
MHCSLKPDLRPFGCYSEGPNGTPEMGPPISPGFWMPFAAVDKHMGPKGDPRFSREALLLSPRQRRAFSGFFEVENFGVGVGVSLREGTRFFWSAGGRRVSHVSGFIQRGVYALLRGYSYLNALNAIVVRVATSRTPR